MATYKRVPLQLDGEYYSAEWDVPRSAGVHLMQIVNVMDEERAELLGEKVRKGATEGQLEHYSMAGFVFEHFMARHIIEVECEKEAHLVRPGECFWCAKCDKVALTLDPDSQRCIQRGHKGIFSTPDALRTDTWRLKEWKFTWKSLRRAGGDEDTEYEHITIGMWKWPVQTMWNCWSLETLGADQEVFFVNGDYKDRTPQIMRYEMDFTPRDLKENWSAVVNKAKELGWV